MASLLAVLTVLIWRTKERGEDEFVGLDLSIPITQTLQSNPMIKTANKLWSGSPGLYALDLVVW
jgi:hypothetical protein